MKQMPNKAKRADRTQIVLTVLLMVTTIATIAAGYRTVVLGMPIDMIRLVAFAACTAIGIQTLSFHNKAKQLNKRIASNLERAARLSAQQTPLADD